MYQQEKKTKFDAAGTLCTKEKTADYAGYKLEKKVSRSTMLRDFRILST
jgi:hypothetical protein